MAHASISWLHLRLTTITIESPRLYLVAVGRKLVGSIRELITICSLCRVLSVQYHYCCAALPPVVNISCSSDQSLRHHTTMACIASVFCTRRYRIISQLFELDEWSKSFMQGEAQIRLSTHARTDPLNFINTSSFLFNPFKEDWFQQRLVMIFKPPPWCGYIPDVYWAP